MLDFYAVEDLGPWPDDLPLLREYVGSMDIGEFHECLPLISPCFVGIGVEISYFTDWTLTSDQVEAALLCLFRSPSEVTGSAQIAVGKFVDAVRQAEGRTLLAVCD